MRASVAAWVALGVAGTLGWACSLYLDPPLDRTAQSDSGPSADGTTPDTGTDASDGGVDADATAPAECTVDKDCPSVNACTVARCDPKRQRCRYDVCPASTCGFKRCDDAFACAPTETPLSFHPHTFSVPGKVSCDRPSQCVALSYPFVYAALDGGVVAIDVTDIGNPSPATFAIEGVDFAPASIVASGRFVYFVGRPFLAATPGIRIGWLDAPRHPFVSKLVAASTPSNFPDPSPSDYRVLPAPSDAVYLGVVLANGQTQYWAQLLAPVATTNAFVILPPTSGGGGAPRTPVASSGDRALVSAANDQFFLVRRPGFDTIALASATTLRPAGEGSSAANSSFAQDDEGRVAWTTATVEGANLGRTRLSWILTGDTTFLDGGLPGVDLAGFDASIPSTTIAAAPGAIVDPSSALGLALDVPSGGTSVQLTRRDGGAVTRVAGRSFVLTSPPGAIVASFAARGKVYVVEQAPVATGDPPMLAVHVFAPSCD